MSNIIKLRKYVKPNNTFYKILVFIFFISIEACNSNLELDRNEMPFDKYDFIRNEYNSTDMGYLLGNAEMGGIADINGLGFEKLWFTDLWEDAEARGFFPNLQFHSKELDTYDLEKSEFRNRYRLKDGVYSTEAHCSETFGYVSKIFFSLEKKHLLVMNLKNTGTKKAMWSISLPLQRYDIIYKENIVNGFTKKKSAYTQEAWVFRATTNLIKNDNEYIFEIEPGEDQTFYFSLTTQFDGVNYKGEALTATEISENYSQIERGHSLAWDNHWSSIASIVLPDGNYAKWYYRALRGIYNTTGAEHFLAAEKQFAVPDVDWKMHSFTYGHGGGWAIWVFAQLGDYKRARDMINWTYKPEALSENVRILFPEGPVEVIYRGKNLGTHTYIEKYNPNAIAFGHEVTAEGHNIPYSTDRHWDWQRHIDGYAAAFFHLLDRLYPDKEFTEEYTYPVLKGTAEFWSSLVKWDELRELYYLPPLLSVSENIMEKSVLDAVLAAKWNLKMACNYACKLNLDKELSEKWQNIYDNLYVPQNSEIYLEYLDDDQNRIGGGYFGIRAFACLGYPYLEEIKNIDKQKARNALDLAWIRNNKGKGMITFISDWFALTEAYLGNGDKAYELSELTTHIQDSSGASLAEAYSYDENGNVKQIYNEYFLTGYDALVLVPISMMLQSYDDKINVFPSIPKNWEDVSFFDLQAEHGIKVSAVIKDGEFKWASFKFNSREILKLYKNKIVKIINTGKDLRLEPIDK
ncbi:MAG: hypothetical protein H6612_03965 [Ignavibacteriales bacterium]|nr:hypothetical protein [Ignavibacteriales bacterium]